MWFDSDYLLCAQSEHIEVKRTTTLCILFEIDHVVIITTVPCLLVSYTLYCSSFAANSGLVKLFLFCMEITNEREMSKLYNRKVKGKAQSWHLHNPSKNQFSEHKI